GASRGKAETQQRIAGDAHAGHGDLREWRGNGEGTSWAWESRAVDREEVSASREFVSEMTEGHGDAVDFRRKRFGHDGKFHEERERSVGEGGVEFERRREFRGAR